MSNETIADIVAEMRTKAKHFEECSKLMVSESALALFLYPIADRIEAAAKREECELLAQIAELRQKIDDGKFFTPKAARDAIAGERPLDEMLKAPLPTGNAAAMREALVAMVKAETDGSMEREDLCGRCLRKLFDECKHDGSCWVDRVMAAISKPPRNCDKFATVDKAMDDFADDALIEEWSALEAGKDRDMLAKELFMFAKWLFEPAAERKGEEDGSK